MSKRYPFNGYEAMASGYTNELYLPSKPLEEWNIDECRRALCRQANGDVMRCLECESPCRYGKRIAVLLAPVAQVEDQTDEKTTTAKSKRGAASAAARKRKAEIKFLQMIASGNPKAYLEAHGMEIRNNMDRVKKLYKGVTPEEARKRLAEMGVEVDGVLGALVTQPVQEQPTIAAEVVTVFDKLPEPKPEPVKNEDVKLNVLSIWGKWFLYNRKEGVYMDIVPNPERMPTLADVDEICAEIKAAFEMMA